MEIAALRSAVTAVFDLGPNARRLLRLLLAEIEDPAEADRPNPPATANGKTATARDPRPATVERKQRRQRAQARMNGAAPAPPSNMSAEEWAQLRSEFHQEIRRRHVTRGALAATIGVSHGAVCGWLAPNSAAPNAANLAKIRTVDGAPAVPAPALAEVQPVTMPAHTEADPAEGSLAPFKLTEMECDRLHGHLSMSDERTLRATFNATRVVLEKAAAGSRVDSEIVARVRAALANGAAE